MHRNIILYIATSIDGFIADKNGGIEWLHDPDYEDQSSDYGYDNLLGRIDTVIMGNETMNFVINAGVPYPYKDYKSYVITRNPEGKSHPHAEYISDWQSTANDLRNAEGKDIWLVGGGQINTLFLEAGLIDEIILTMIPCVLGEGIPLFPAADGLKKFELLETKCFNNGMAQLHYKIKPQ